MKLKVYLPIKRKLFMNSSTYLQDAVARLLELMNSEDIPGIR